MRVCVVGIDPGKEGAVCVVSNDPVTVDLVLLKDFMDKPRRFRDFIDFHKPNHVYLEKAQSMPAQGVSSVFTYGTGFGQIIGWLEMLEVPYMLVSPHIWTKEMHKGCTGKDGKAKSQMAVRALFPDEDLSAEGAKKIHPGYMDARLIAEYGRRIYR